MKFTWDTVALADDAFPAFDISLNGQQLVQEADFMRAAAASFFARHNRKVALKFSAQKTFADVQAAENFTLNQHNTLVDGPATLTVMTGAFGQTPQAVLIQNAVLESIDCKYLGVAVTSTYSFKAPKVSTLPYTPTTEDVRTASVSIPNGVNNFTVTGQAFPSTPNRVIATVRKPVSGFQLAASIEDGSITTDGFKVWLTGTTDSSNYKLDFAYSL